MTRSSEIAEFQAQDGAVLDVRSPAEYAHGHIPGAKSLPLFSDAERAEIGTLYKQRGRDLAIHRGIALVGPRLSGLVDGAAALVANGESRRASLRVYCWRGGMRSEFVSWFLSFVGNEVTCLKGGYKAFRRDVLLRLSQLVPLVVLGGFTGSGKTEVLEALMRKGEAVLDLEALACHRGSVYGEFPDREQPSYEQFENVVAERLRQLTGASRVWVEDESRLIGRLPIPRHLFSQMKQAPMYVLESSFRIRLERLLREYGQQPYAWWQACTQKLAKRLGGVRLRTVCTLLEQEKLMDAIEILLYYYDSAYALSMKRHQGHVEHVCCHETGEETARALLRKVGGTE